MLKLYFSRLHSYKDNPRYRLLSDYCILTPALNTPVSKAQSF
jgi:hypothetical protein